MSNEVEKNERAGGASDREKPSGTLPIYRHRIINPLVLGMASVLMAIVSYRSTVSSRRDAERKSELSAIELRAKTYTDDQVQSLRTNFYDFRSTITKSVDKLEERVEYNNKLIWAMKK